MSNTVFPKDPFKHPEGEDFFEHLDDIVQFDPPTQEIPANGRHFEGLGVVFGKDRPGLVTVHGDDSDGFPIIPVERS